MVNEIMVWFLVMLIVVPIALLLMIAINKIKNVRSIINFENGVNNYIERFTESVIDLADPFLQWIKDAFVVPYPLRLMAILILIVIIYNTSIFQRIFNAHEYYRHRLHVDEQSLKGAETRVSADFMVRSPMLAKDMENVSSLQSRIQQDKKFLGRDD